MFDYGRDSALAMLQHLKWPMLQCRQWVARLSTLRKQIKQTNKSHTTFFHLNVSPEDTIDCITTFLELTQGHTSRAFPPRTFKEWNCLVRVV